MILSLITAMCLLIDNFMSGKSHTLDEKATQGSSKNVYVILARIFIHICYVSDRNQN